MAISNRSKFEQLLDKYEPLIKAAFLEAIADIRSQVTLKLLVERLERGDVQGALDVMQIERSAFGPLELALAEAYNAGGMGMASDLKLRDPEGNRIVFRFGVRNPEAERWLAEHSSTLVTRIVEDQRHGIRTALTEGLVRGDNPNRTALDVVGRKSRVTGKREGGIIGLTAPQERFVASARTELLSGDPVLLRNYLDRGRRDKRFDRTVLKALQTQKPLDRETVGRITSQYSERLLSLRGEMLARTETLNGLAKSRFDAIAQAIQSGKVDAEFVTKVWRHSHAEHPRMQHLAMNGREVSFFEPFVMADGTPMMHPHDPNAPASHTVGCRCREDYRIDYARMGARRAA